MTNRAQREREQRIDISSFAVEMSEERVDDVFILKRTVSRSDNRNENQAQIFQDDIKVTNDALSSESQKQRKRAFFAISESKNFDTENRLMTTSEQEIHAFQISSLTTRKSRISRKQRRYIIEYEKSEETMKETSLLWLHLIDDIKQFSMTITIQEAQELKNSVAERSQDWLDELEEIFANLATLKSFHKINKIENSTLRANLNTKELQIQAQAEKIRDMIDIIERHVENLKLIKKNSTRYKSLRDKYRDKVEKFNQATSKLRIDNETLEKKIQDLLNK